MNDNIHYYFYRIVICGGTGPPATSAQDTRECSATIKTPADCGEFQCLGIKIFSVGKPHHAAVPDVQMWVVDFYWKVWLVGV